MSGTAQTTVLAALNAVIRDHGWLVTGNAARLRATLSDVLGPTADEHRGLVDAIVVSAEEGVPAEVRAAGRPGLPDVGPTLTARLVDWGMAADRAEWVVEAWGSLLPDSTLKPATAPAPPVERRTDPEPATQPTALPPPAVEPHFAPTMLPPTPTPTPTQTTPTPDRPAGARSRRTLVIAAVAAVVIALGGVAGAIALTGDDKKPESSSTDDPTDEGLPKATGSELVLSPVEVSSIRPVLMGGYRDGVSLIGLSTVDTLTGYTGEEYAAPEGGSLIGFRIDTGGCELKDICTSWWDTRLSLEIDGASKPLPDFNTDGSAATFVAAVPAGAQSVDLVLQSDGRRQSISLLTGQASSGNIAVLARNKRFWNPNKRFKATESVTININYGDGVGRRSVTRSAEVTEYSLQYWANNKKNSASAADRALLRVNTFYHYPFDENPDETVWYWRSDEVQFRDAQGRLYRPVRMPKNKDSAWYDYEFFFDVPASITGGTLLLGGSVDLVGGDGTPYTATTPVTSVPLRLT